MNRIGIFLILLLPFFGSACAKQAHKPMHTMTEKTETKSESASSTSASPESPYQDITKIKPGQIVHLKTGQTLSESEVIETLAASRIIYAGEVHDSLEDHKVQLKILKGLVARFPGQVVVGMEMFRRSSQAVLDQWIKGDGDEKVFLKRWYEDWSHNDAYYRALLDYIKAEKIPLIALRPTSEMAFKMRASGMAGLSENDKKKLPEIDDNDLHHRTAVNAIFQGHGPGASEQFESFYQMMLFWEETMSETIADYLSSPEGKDKKMMVMAGGFHVGYGFGLPRRTFRRLPVPYQIVIPHAQNFPDEMKMLDVKAPNLPLQLADFVWGVSYQVRLGIMMDQFQAGVQVSDVFPDSPAAKAGIKKGDIVSHMDDVTIHERFDIIYYLQSKKPGDRIKIKLIRNGKSIETEALMTASGSGHP